MFKSNCWLNSNITFTFEEKRIVWITSRMLLWLEQCIKIPEATKGKATIHNVINIWIDLVWICHVCSTDYSCYCHPHLVKTWTSPCPFSCMDNWLYSWLHCKSSSCILALCPSKQTFGGRTWTATYNLSYFDFIFIRRTQSAYQWYCLASWVYHNCLSKVIFNSVLILILSSLRFYILRNPPMQSHSYAF